MNRFAEERERASQYCIHILLFSSIIMQKFGAPLGSSFVTFSLPIFISTIYVMALRGYLRISFDRCILYGCLVIFALTAILFSTMTFNSKNSLSIPSLLLFLALFSTFIFDPTRKFSVEMAVPIFLKYSFFIACCGVLQDLLQHIGYQFVNFSTIFPFLKPVLVEGYFNDNAVVAYGSTEVRSNGLFMREPSLLSQLVVIGGVVEFYFKRRIFHLAVYIVAYFVSISGTGIMALCVAVFISSLISAKHALRLPLYLAGAAIAYTLLATIFPEVLNQLVSRTGEFAIEGTSGYYRYIAQGIAWSDLFSDSRFLYGWGPGGFDRNYLAIYSIAGNPILKYTAEYGVFTMLAAILLFLKTVWWRQHLMISTLVISTFQLGGGLELSPDFFAQVFILIVCGKVSIRQPHINNKTDTLSNYRGV